MKLSAKMFVNVSVRKNKCLILAIILLSYYYDDSNKSIVVKMKDETAGVAIKKIVELKPRIYFILVDDSSEHKKANDVNKNVFVATRSYNEYRDALLNHKCLRHSINRIQSISHRVGTYGMNKISLSYFDDKVFILNNGYNDLALGYQS